MRKDLDWVEKEWRASKSPSSFLRSLAGYWKINEFCAECRNHHRPIWVDAITLSRENLDRDKFISLVTDWLRATEGSRRQILSQLPAFRRSLEIAAGNELRSDECCDLARIVGAIPRRQQTATESQPIVVCLGEHSHTRGRSPTTPPLTLQCLKQGQTRVYPVWCQAFVLYRELFLES